MTTEDSEARYRLPRTVTPSRYELVLEPDLAAGSFAGSEDVTVTVVEPVTEIVLNAVDLEITRGSLQAADGRRIEIAEIRLDPETERAHLRLSADAEPGEWTLHLDFSGELNDKLVGFYRSTYEGPDGGTEVIATTHFEATDARRAFPSWDEPDLKAVFGVTLIVAPDLTALSNGPEIERTTLDDGRVRVVFADTMSMSTYLVAFVVGHLELTDPVDAGGVPTGSLTCRASARSRPSRWRSARTRSRGSPTTTASRTRTRRSTTSPCPTSRRAPWRTWAASRTGRRRCSSTPPRRRTGSSSTWPRPSPTSSRTCGSATWSRCVGGTACG